MDSEPPELLQLLARPPNARAHACAARSLSPAEPVQAMPLDAQRRDRGAAGPPAAARRQSFDAVEAELQASQYGSSSQPVAGADGAPGSPDPSPGAWGAPRQRDPSMPATQASQAEAAFLNTGGPQNPQDPGDPTTSPRPPAVEGAVVASNYGTGDVVAMRFEAAPAAVSLAARAAGAQGLLARRRQGFGGISVRPAGGDLLHQPGEVLIPR